MSLVRFGSDNTFLTLNGVTFENFGDTDPPYVISDLEDRMAIKGGIGRTGLRLDNARRPRQLVVYTMPGSAESTQMVAWDKAGTIINGTHRVSGTEERVIMIEGGIQRRGDMGRSGKASVTDDAWTLVFLDSDET